MGEREIPWHEGMTVADLLRALEDPFPYAVVRIGQRTVSRPFFETTAVPDGAEVHLITLVAGG